MNGGNRGVMNIAVGGTWRGMMMTDQSQTTDLFDVIATQIRAPHKRRIMDRGMTKTAAESYIKFAVYRRGVDEEFYSAVPAGSVQDD